ncbi:hypothetical protein ABW19_dt0201228 [Dactylella cylindrospora]|nr:hypothetical protein ABW19_dt0201228 [Dactylella cylindrospora]
MSDFLRLLTRSTTVAKAAAPPKPPKSEPIADTEAISTSKKRKRKTASSSAAPNSSTAVTTTVVGVQAEIVGKSDRDKKKKKKSKKRKRDEVEEDYDEILSGKVDDNLDPAEVRSILKQHRLKYTILATMGSPEELLKSREVPEDAKSKKHKKDKKGKPKKKKSEEELPKDKEPKEAPKSSKLNQIFPTPILAFEELRVYYNISKRLYQNIIAQKFSDPTEVQMGSLPLLLDKQEGQITVPELEGCDVDLMIIAPTGSGKTLAYAIPAINNLIKLKHEEGEHYERSIRVIVLSPTRELADQIVNEFRKLLLGTGIKVVGMKKSLIPKERRRGKDPHQQHEGSSDEEEPEDESEEDSDDESLGEATAPKKDSSKEGMAVKSEIMVATPLLLLHAIELCPDLFPVSHVTRIILDEADVLLDDLFLSQTTSIISHLTSPSLHFSFWSATMPSSSETLAQNLISSHPSALNATKPRKLVRLIAGIKDSSLPTIRQTLTYTASERGKLLALRQLFNTSLKTPCLIFLQTIPRAQALHAEIMYDLPTPNRIAVLHSNLSETARSKVMDEFRKGEIWMLITTDLLSRGVDFRGVNLVINYDIPTSVASYIHRIGRTGRAGREGGQAITYYTEEDVKYVRGIVQVMEKSGGGDAGGIGGVQKWMLESLPKTTKEEKKELKRKGVKERRVGIHEDGGKKGRISTKSGYDRKLEGRKKAAIEVSRRRTVQTEDGSDEDDSEGSESEWEGLE